MNSSNRTDKLRDFKTKTIVWAALTFSVAMLGIFVLIVYEMWGVKFYEEKVISTTTHGNISAEVIHFSGVGTDDATLVRFRRRQFLWWKDWRTFGGMGLCDSVELTFEDEDSVTLICHHAVGADRFAFRISGLPDPMYKGDYKQFRIKIGHAKDQIGIDTSSGPGSEQIISSSFAVDSRGSIWIDDPVHHRTCKFSPSSVDAEIKTDSLIVDDMVFLGDDELAVSFWNSPKVIVYRKGKPAYSCELPHDPVAETNLYARNRNLFVDFKLHREGDVYPHRIGLEFDSSGELLRVRQDSAAMWAATCGQLHGNAIDLWYDYTLAFLVDSTGKPWLSKTSDMTVRATEIGSDRMGNMYFLQRTSDAIDDSSFVLAYTPRGERFRRSPIRNVDVNSHHWVKVDRWGDVYVLTSPEGSSDIVIEQFR